MKIQFYGAAGEVTGSCHIVECQGRKVLVDCGLVQGGRQEWQRNHEPFPFDVDEIEAVILTHAHIDHSGRLPLLHKRGFRGKVYSQKASCDLANVLLRDSAHLQEMDTERRNRKRAERGEGQLKPLYTIADAEGAIECLRGVRYREWVEVIPGLRCRYWDAGHILGSASVEVMLTEQDETRRVIFSGDLGQYDTPILRDPAVLEGGADLVIMESTYGNRLHRNRDDTLREIAEIIELAATERGTILIPAFAIGRSQEVLYHLADHYQEWGIERFRIFLDSPMAIEASEIYWDYPQLYDDEATQLRRGEREMQALPNLFLTRTANESKVINQVDEMAIIIAGSGMCTGGRIVHHLKHRLGRPNTHLLIIGYQAHGTLGRRLVDGDDQVRIHGQAIDVAAQVHTLGGFSAHGDQQDLCRWLQQIDPPPRVSLVHGEADTAQEFSQYLRDTLQLEATVAQPGETLDLLERPAVTV
ncbi:MAG: MBL fold metallo-hydrolase [Wenzhouxiangellaceae bacterium]